MQSTFVSVLFFSCQDLGQAGTGRPISWAFPEIRKSGTSPNVYICILMSLNLSLCVQRFQKLIYLQFLSVVVLMIEENFS